MYLNPHLLSFSFPINSTPSSSSKQVHYNTEDNINPTQYAIFYYCSKHNCLCCSCVSLQSTLAALFLNVDANSSSTYSTFAQDLPNPCTYTATPCGPIPGGPTEVITVYEDPSVITATSTFDCQGCSAVTVVPKDCFGLGLVSPFLDFGLKMYSLMTV